MTVNVRVQQLYDSLRGEDILSGMLPRGYEVLTFLWPNASAAHLLRLLQIIDWTKTSLDVSMYGLTHCKLVSALIRVH